jgi:hypothetical protein
MRLLLISIDETGSRASEMQSAGEVLPLCKLFTGPASHAALSGKAVADSIICSWLDGETQDWAASKIWFCQAAARPVWRPCRREIR